MTKNGIREEVVKVLKRLAFRDNIIKLKVSSVVEKHFWLKKGLKYVLRVSQQSHHRILANPAIARCVQESVKDKESKRKLFFLFLALILQIAKFKTIFSASNISLEGYDYGKNCIRKTSVGFKGDRVFVVPSFGAAKEKNIQRGFSRRKSIF